MDSDNSQSKICAVCKSRAQQICGGCGEVYYCSRDHQKSHWAVHKTQCKPYKILTDPKFGRYMVASRNLKPGDVVFRERALAVGPKQGSKPVCLTCFASLENLAPELLFRCPGCCFPFCRAECAKVANHKAECEILAHAKGKLNIDDMSKPHPVYECITPLRCVMLKTSNPQQYETFANLQNHNELRRGTDLWRVNQINVVDFLRSVCKLEQKYTEDEIHGACGVMDVNAFEIRIATTGQRVVGVFPTAAMMAHHCVSNIYHIIDSDYQMTVRASVPIPRGQPVFMSYSHSLEGTMARRASLLHSKFFECDCSRCSDPAELGTHMSTMRCQQCQAGLVLPLNPLDKATDWHCDKCTYKVTASVIDKVVHRLKTEFDEIGPNQVEEFEGFLKRHSSLLHQNHYFFTDARHSLSQLYGRDERYLLPSLSEEQLERKIVICKQLMDVINVVEPGLTRLRGVTLYEMHAPLLLLARRQFDDGKITNAELKEKVQEVRSILSEACKILSLEDPASPEGAMGTASVQALEQIQSWIASL